MDKKWKDIAPWNGGLSVGTGKADQIDPNDA